MIWRKGGAEAPRAVRDTIKSFDVRGVAQW